MRALESAAVCVRVARNYEATALDLLGPARPNTTPRRGPASRARQAAGYQRRACKTWVVAAAEALAALLGGAS